MHKTRQLILCGLSAVFLIGTSLIATRRLMWNDELFTFYIAMRPTFKDVWAALLTGTEQLPPFFYVVTRASFRLFGVSHFSIRLPEIFGFWVLCLALFHYVARRTSFYYGVVAFLFPLITSAYSYAYEARPYGLVLGFIALGLLCWQMATENRARFFMPALAICIAAAVSSHYYAVLFLFPLVFGELVRSYSLKKFDLRIWISFACGLLPLFFFLPLMQSATGYSAAFWSKSQWASITNFYTYLLEPVALPLMALMVVFALRSGTPSNKANSIAFSIPTHEIAAAFAFLVVPILAVLLGKFFTGAYTDRSIIPVVIGFSVLFSWGTCWLFQGRTNSGATIALVFCCWFIVREINLVRSFNGEALRQNAAFHFLEAQNHADLPIVIPDPFLFFQLAHYAPQSIAGRLCYLSDRQQARRYVGTDHVERGLLELKQWAPLDVEDFHSYLAIHKRFLIYGGSGIWGWSLSRLLTDGIRIKMIAQNEDKPLYLVEPQESQ